MLMGSHIYNGLYMGLQFNVSFISKISKYNFKFHKIQDKVMPTGADTHNKRLTKYVKVCHCQLSYLSAIITAGSSSLIWTTSHNSSAQYAVSVSPTPGEMAMMMLRLQPLQPATCCTAHSLTTVHPSILRMCRLKPEIKAIACTFMKNV